MAVLKIPSGKLNEINHAIKLIELRGIEAYYEIIALIDLNLKRKTALIDLNLKSKITPADPDHQIDPADIDRETALADLSLKLETALADLNRKIALGILIMYLYASGIKANIADLLERHGLPAANDIHRAVTLIQTDGDEALVTVSTLVGPEVTLAIFVMFLRASYGSLKGLIPPNPEIDTDVSHFLGTNQIVFIEEPVLTED